MPKKKVTIDGTSMLGVIGKMGSDNYIVKDTPCLIPKENLRMFNAMRKSTEKSTFSDFYNPKK